MIFISASGFREVNAETFILETGLNTKLINSHSLRTLIMVAIFYIYSPWRLEWLHFIASKFKMTAISTTHRNVWIIWPCNLQCERRSKRADVVVQGINVVVKCVDTGRSTFQHPTLEQSLCTLSYKRNRQEWYFWCSLTFVQSFICTMTETTSHKRVFWFQGISFNMFIFLTPHILFLWSL
jgi:hypothetical protein